MVWLYKDPKGEKIFTAASASQGTLQLSKIPVNTAEKILSDQNTSDKEKIDLLAARVRELESQQVSLLLLVYNEHCDNISLLHSDCVP